MKSLLCLFCLTFGVLRLHACLLFVYDHDLIFQLSRTRYWLGWALFGLCPVCCGRVDPVLLVTLVCLVFEFCRFLVLDASIGWYYLAWYSSF